MSTSLDTLLEAAKYLEYQSIATSRGEIPQDYSVYSNALKNGVPVFQLPSSSEVSTGENSYSFNEDVRERRRGGGSGTREVHNKLEKNRRAHLKKCFETLKKQIPNMDEKKTSNLGILRSALRYIQTLHRKDRECAQDLESLAQEKISLQKRLYSLRKELSCRVDEGVIHSAVLAAAAADDDSNSTSTASECGPLSDAEDAKPYVYTQASLGATSSVRVESRGVTGNDKGATIATAPWHSVAVTSTITTTTTTSTTAVAVAAAGHQVYGRTLAPHPPVLTPGSVVHGVSRAGPSTTLTFGPLPPRLQLTSVGFPAQTFHHAGLNGASPTMLTHPTVQVLTNQQSPVRLIATPVGAAAGSSVTLTMGAPGATRLAYAATSGTVLTAAQQQLPVTATLASMQTGGLATRTGAGPSIAGPAQQPGTTIAFAQLAVKPENGAFSALTAAAALSFKNAVPQLSTGSVSPSATLSVANGTTSHIHHTSNSTFARHLVAATVNATGQQQQQQQVVVPVAAGFLQQFLPQLSAGKPLVVVTAAPTLSGCVAPQTIVASTLPVSR